MYKGKHVFRIVHVPGHAKQNSSFDHFKHELYFHDFQAVSLAINRLASFNAMIFKWH